jgi:hypothetical protein
VQPMFTIREFRNGEDRELAILSLWGLISWLFGRQQYFWAIPILLCSGIWPYCRLLLSSLTASPKAVLLVPAQRRRRLAILRDLGMLSAIAPCMMLSFIVVFHVEYKGELLHRTKPALDIYDLTTPAEQILVGGLRQGRLLVATFSARPWSCLRSVVFRPALWNAYVEVVFFSEPVRDFSRLTGVPHSRSTLKSQIFGTVLALRVTNGFAVGSGRAVEDMYYTELAGETQVSRLPIKSSKANLSFHRYY